MSSWKRPFISCIAVLVAAVMVPALAAAQTGAGACGCDDVEDIVNRINVANAAITEYNAQSKAIGPTVMTNAGGPPNNYRVMQTSVTAAQTAVQIALARDATGETSGVTCTTENMAPTACLRELVDFHEAFHRDRCTADKARRKLGLFDDRMAGKPLTEMLLEEIAAYEREIQEALRRLRAMSASCRPKGWIGTLTVLEAKRLNITATNNPPANNRFALGGTDTSDNRMSRFGTIYYRGGAVTGYMKSEQVHSQSTVSKMRVGCTGGLASREPDRVQTNTYQADAEDRGFTDKIPPVALSIGADQRSYTISLTIPAIPGEAGAATLTGFTSSTGGCQDENKPFPSATQTSQTLDAMPLTLQGTMPPGSKDISGSQTINLMPAGGIGGVTGSHLIEVRWNLHQVN